MKSVIVTPMATEKAYRLVTLQNTYIFKVPLLANKDEIVKAVEAQYEGTKVASIKTAVQTGKSIRFSRGKNRNPGNTTRQNTKKAYVTLSEGKIKVFEQEETKEDPKAKKEEKK